MISVLEIAAMSRSEYIGYMMRKVYCMTATIPDFKVGDTVISNEAYNFVNSPPSGISGTIAALDQNANGEYFAQVEWENGLTKWYFRAELKKTDHCSGCRCNPCDCDWGTDE